MDEKIPIKIPDEKCGNASGFIDINTTTPGGDKGNVEELDRAIKRDLDILKK